MLKCLYEIVCNVNIVERTQGHYMNYIDLANEYDNLICKRSYFDTLYDEQYPSDEEWKEQQQEPVC